MTDELNTRLNHRAQQIKSGKLATQLRAAEHVERSFSFVDGESTIRELCDTFQMHHLHPSHFVAVPEAFVKRYLTMLDLYEMGYREFEIPTILQARAYDEIDEFNVLVAIAGDIQIWCEICAGTPMWNVLRVEGIDITYDGLAADKEIICVRYHDENAINDCTALQ